MTDLGSPREVTLADLLVFHANSYGAATHDYQITITLNGTRVVAVLTVDLDAMPEGVVFMKH